MKTFVVLVILAGSIFGQFETIQLVGPLSEKTKDRLWPVLLGGTIIITEDMLALPDGSEIYLQSRVAPYSQTTIPLGKKPTSDIDISELCLSDKFYYCTFYASDGRIYLVRKDRETGEVLGPFLKHWMTGRILLMNENKLLVSGLYRPGFVSFMDRHTDRSTFNQSASTQAKIDEYYQKEKAFSLAYYDASLNLIDSANTIERVGEDIRTLERLYIRHPIDNTSLGDVFLIDNTEGYFVERYAKNNKLISSFRVPGEHFREIPPDLTKEKYEIIRTKAGVYSVAYALYIKGEYIITGYFQAPVRGEAVAGPYYYDIMTLSGAQVYNGTLEYPIITEDEADKVFLHVKREGGWFEDDKIFLVGLTIQDFLDGKAQKEIVDAAIDQYLKDQEND